MPSDEKFLGFEQEPQPRSMAQALETLAHMEEQGELESHSTKEKLEPGEAYEYADVDVAVVDLTPNAPKDAWGTHQIVAYTTEDGEVEIAIPDTEGNLDTEQTENNEDDPRSFARHYRLKPGEKAYFAYGRAKENDIQVNVIPEVTESMSRNDGQIVVECNEQGKLNIKAGKDEHSSFGREIGLAGYRLAQEDETTQEKSKLTGFRSKNEQQILKLPKSLTREEINEVVGPNFELDEEKTFAPQNILRVSKDLEIPKMYYNAAGTAHKVNQEAMILMEASEKVDSPELRELEEALRIARNVATAKVNGRPLKLADYEQRMLSKISADLLYKGADKIDGFELYNALAALKSRFGGTRFEDMPPERKQHQNSIELYLRHIQYATQNLFPGREPRETTNEYRSRLNDKIRNTAYTGVQKYRHRRELEKKRIDKEFK